MSLLKVFLVTVFQCFMKCFKQGCGGGGKMSDSNSDLFKISYSSLFKIF